MRRDGRGRLDVRPSMPRCRASGIAHAGGLVRHGVQRLWALRDDGKVVQLGHPDHVLRLAAGDRDIQIRAIVGPADAPAPPADAFTTGRLPDGMVATRTSFRQASSSHDFPVSARARDWLHRMVRLSGQRRTADGTVPGPLWSEDRQADVETERWVALAGKVGMLDLQRAVATFTDPSAPPPQGAAYLRVLVEHHLIDTGRLTAGRREVRPRPDDQRLPDGAIDPELHRLGVRAGRRPRRRLQVRTVADHAKIRFLERVDRTVGPDVVSRAVEVAELRDRVKLDPTVRDDLDDAEAELDELVAETVAPGTGRTVGATVAELVSNEIHNPRFAYDADELSGGELAAFAPFRDRGARYRRFTLLVDDPFDVSGDAGSLAVVCEVAAPTGTARQRAHTTFVDVISCMHVPAELRSDLPGAPIVARLARPVSPGRYTGPDAASPLPPDPKLRARTEQVLLEAVGRR